MLSDELRNTIQLQPIYAEIIAPVICDQLELIDRILQANRTSSELDTYRKLATDSQDQAWRLTDGLLTRNGALVVPTLHNGHYLRTELIREAHSTIVTAHPGK